MTEAKNYAFYFFSAFGIHKFAAKFLSQTDSYY